MGFLGRLIVTVVVVLFLSFVFAVGYQALFVLRVPIPDYSFETVFKNVWPAVAIVIVLWRIWGWWEFGDEL